MSLKTMVCALVVLLASTAANALIPIPRDYGIKGYLTSLGIDPSPLLVTGDTIAIDEDTPLLDVTGRIDHLLGEVHHNQYWVRHDMAEGIYFLAAVRELPMDFAMLLLIYGAGDDGLAQMAIYDYGGHLVDFVDLGPWNGSQWLTLGRGEQASVAWLRCSTMLVIDDGSESITLRNTSPVGERDVGTVTRNVRYRFNVGDRGALALDSTWVSVSNAATVASQPPLSEITDFALTPRSKVYLSLTTLNVLARRDDVAALLAGGDDCEAHYAMLHTIGTMLHISTGQALSWFSRYWDAKRGYVLLPYVQECVQGGQVDAGWLRYAVENSRFMTNPERRDTWLKIIDKWAPRGQ